MFRQHRLINQSLLVFTLLLTFVAATGQAQTNELTASVDRREVSINETLTLRVRYSGQVQSGPPDFSLLEEQFEIINRQRSNQISAINGVMSAFTEWTLTLSPKTTGQLLIPSFKYEGQYSDAIQIEVTDASQAPNQLRDVFIETTLDKTQAYVQQQVILTYRLYTTRSIDSLDAEPLVIDGVRVEELAQNRYQRQVSGTTYGVLEVRYALFPQVSETFTVPSLRWSLRVVTSRSRGGFGLGTGRYELKRFNTEEKTVQVQPKPGVYPPNAPWLPASDLELTEEWSEPPSNFQVGEPITRTIQLRAEGLTAAQLPPLPLGQTPSGVKLYPDQAKQDDQSDTDGITGVRTESMAIVPNRAGEITLPPIELTWWDTTTEEVRTATLPAKTVYVQGNGSGSTSAPPATEAPAPIEDVPIQERDSDTVAAEGDTSSGSSLLWQLTALVFALLWLVFAILWWRARRAEEPRRHSGQASSFLSPQAVQEKQAFQAVKTAAQEQQLHNLRRALIHWSASRWPEAPPRSLQELGRALGDTQITSQLAALDATLYGNTTAELQTGQLVQDLEKWRKEAKPQHGKQQQLKPLY